MPPSPPPICFRGSSIYPRIRAFCSPTAAVWGAFFELQPVATDGQSAEYLAGVSRQLQDLITDAIPEDDPDPWVLQVFIQDEPSFHGLCELRTQAASPLIETPFTQHHLQTLEAHLARSPHPEVSLRTE